MLPPRLLDDADPFRDRVTALSDIAVTPPDLHREMATLVPGARRVIVEGAGHITPIEQPEAVSRALRAWLLDADAP